MSFLVEELAIQWDTAVEFAILEGIAAIVPGPMLRPKSLSAWFGSGIACRRCREAGYHLCYGDVEHQHFIEPVDMTKLVAVANGVGAGVERSLDWIHMPVPRGRNDDAYFAPLSGLELAPETELYLGLVHLTDGVDGTNGRIAAAQRVVRDFGVATECGFGRRPAETVPALLDVHASVADPR